MPRIRHVFDTDDEIRDLWIAGELDWARQRNHTSLFRGPYFYRKLGGDAVRFTAPDGTVFCISDRSYRLPEDWHLIGTYLTERLRRAGEVLSKGTDTDSLETIRHGIDGRIKEVLREAETGKRFSRAQSSRFHVAAELHASRQSLSSAYGLGWKPLMEQRSIAALAAYEGLGSHHVAETRNADQNRSWQEERERLRAEAETPVDDETSVAEWLAGRRLRINEVVRQRPVAYLRVAGGKVECSHGGRWSALEFNRIARLLIMSLRDGRYWHQAAIRSELKGSSVLDVDPRGVTLSTHPRTNPCQVDVIIGILGITAPRLGRSLQLAREEHAERNAAEEEALAEMAMGHRR